MPTELFDSQVSRYDAWYGSTKGAAAFEEELAALRPLLKDLAHPWLEVGVGTGRFAHALHAEVGIDPALAALALALHGDPRSAPVTGPARRLFCRVATPTMVPNIKMWRTGLWI